MMIAGYDYAAKVLRLGRYIPPVAPDKDLPEAVALAPRRVIVRK